ncbi:Uu.00g123730.m01.CDS01 [Anthostomella pinea]|uniref:Uu.00g123730.m01.CDS01 n=1 Tax=Anthostomella pinea TaxID=933095 RepID=A0AAI8YHI6_9PEZI|nr:Uu.00g123730.m01.CDS01 [Anthostomella pinea]
MSSGRRGPVGGLIGMLGKDVGAAAEYREHRKQQKQNQDQLSREKSQQGDQNQSVEAARSSAASSALPPQYGEAVTSEEGMEHSSVASRGGPPARDDGKAAMSHHHKVEDDDDDNDDDVLSVEDDEEVWELDEAMEPAGESGGAHQVPPSYGQSEADYRTTDELVEDVMRTSRRAAASSGGMPKVRVRQPLPLPVIIPQRRPRTKARVWVHAYAPALENCGISQETFMAFLDNFDKDSKASPVFAVFAVIAVSAGIAGLAPSMIVMAVTTAVQLAAQKGADYQRRQRTNGFLDWMNAELFRPAGLYAFIMKYEADADGENDNNNNSSSRGLSDRLNDFRLASGTTQDSIQLPEAAPLIFPAIDRAIVRNGAAEETFKDKVKDAKMFLADYMDRRAHMAYASQDPNSSLALPEEQRAFMSTLADPNHPMYHGGLVGFVSGGNVSVRAGRRRRRDGRQELGEGLSKMEQARYEQYVPEQEEITLGGRRGLRGGSRSPLGGRSPLSGRGHGCGRGRGRGGRGRRGGGGGGPLGLVSGLIGSAVNAASGSAGGTQSAQENAAYADPYAQGHGHAEYGDDARSREFEGTYEDDRLGLGSGGGSAYRDDLRRRSYYARDAYGRSTPAQGDERLGSSSSSAYHSEYDSRQQRPSSSHDPRIVSGGSAVGSQQYGSNRRRNAGNKSGRGDPIGAVKRMMREDVLHLMIVNMPSEAELAEARAEMAK